MCWFYANKRHERGILWFFSLALQTLQRKFFRICIAILPNWHKKTPNGCTNCVHGWCCVKFVVFLYCTANIAKKVFVHLHCNFAKLTKNTKRLHKLRTRRRCAEICGFSLLHGKHRKESFCASALQFCQIDKKHPTVAQIAYTADVVQKFFVVKKKKANNPFWIAAKSCMLSNGKAHRWLFTVIKPEKARKLGNSVLRFPAPRGTAGKLQNV